MADYEEGHTCKECGKSYNKKWRLEEHKRSHTGERPYKCEIDGCGKSFIRPYHLKRHNLVHTGQEILKCSYPGCTKTFCSKHSLKRHEKRSHDKPFKCQYEGCSESFKKSSQLRRHTCIHTNEKPFKCQVEGCDAGFVTPSKLQRHMKMHNKGYMCSTCSAAFDKFSKLRVHMRSHGFACNLCDKTFSEVWELKKHSAIHTTNRKLYECPKEGCSRVYTKAFNLRVHIKAFHEGHRPYLCTWEGCAKGFAHRNSLKQHLVLHSQRRIKPTPSPQDISPQKKKKKRKPVSLAKQLSGYRSSLSESSDNHCTETAPKKRKPLNIQPQRNEADRAMDTSTVNSNASQDLDAHQGGDRTSSSLNGVTESTNVMSTSTTTRNKDNTEIMAGPTDSEGIVTLANTSQDLDAHQGGDRISSSLNGATELTNVMSTSTTARHKDKTEIMAGPTDPEGIVTLANTSQDMDAHQGGDRTSSSLNGVSESTNVMSTSTTARNKDNTEIMAGPTDPEGIVTLANTSIPASPCNDAVMNPETQDKSNGVQGHIFADGSPASVSSCNDSAVVSNRPEVMQGEVTSTPLSSYLHEQNAETLPGDDVFPSSDEDGELMEWDPAGCENSGANSPVTCEPELENVFEGTTSNICASQESSEVGNGSSYQGSSSEQGNTTSSPMRINAEIVSTVLSAVCVNNLDDQVETRRTKRSMNKEGKGRSSIISERNNADASSSASEETISVLQPEPPIVGLETFCNNGDSGKTGNAVRSSDFPGMDDVLQVIIAEEENERGSFQCETSAHPEGVNGYELYMDTRSTDDAGGGRERYPETQMMRPSRTDLNVPHGSVPHWSQEKNSDDVGGLLDDSFNDVSHDYENIDSDDEDIVLSELVKRSRDSSAPKEQVTRDRGHNKQGCSSSSTGHTRKIDKSSGPTRDQGHCESGEVTDSGKSQRLKRSQVDLPRNISVDDSNPPVEVTRDKNTDERVPKTPLRSISKSSKQKSKKNASAKQTTKKSISYALKKPPVSHSMGRSQNKSAQGVNQADGNNSKVDDHGPETDKNTDITTNARDEYDEDVSKAKCRNKELIFSFDLQTLELLWNFKGK